MYAPSDIRQDGLLIEPMQVNMWSQTGKAVYKCESAYGSGLPCLRAQAGSHTSYAASTVSYSQPSP
jgi:rhamnogalacturonan hydrolase